MNTEENEIMLLVLSIFTYEAQISTNPYLEAVAKAACTELLLLLFYFLFIPNWPLQ